MPIKVNEVSGEQFLVVHVWGKLVKADYEYFLPQFAELSRHPGKLRLLFDLIGFEGWEAGALYEELKFDLSTPTTLSAWPQSETRNGSVSWRS